MPLKYNSRHYFILRGKGGFPTQCMRSHVYNDKIGIYYYLAVLFGFLSLFWTTIFCTSVDASQVSKHLHNHPTECFANEPFSEFIRSLVSDLAGTQTTILYQKS